MKKIIKLIIKSQLFAAVAGLKLGHTASKNILTQAANYWQSKLEKARTIFRSTE